MSFAKRVLGHTRPASVRNGVQLPRRQNYLASPVDWRNEILYFLLVDRFSDGKESTRPLLDRTQLANARPKRENGEEWQWTYWVDSGANRWQGGTLKGVMSKLTYLARLGITALWLAPIFKQRGHLNTYHGYGIQDFLDVDPRFGDRSDLVDLVNAAHGHGIRVILDIVFNHSGDNWMYPDGSQPNPDEPAYTTGQYSFGKWLGEAGDEITAIAGSEDGAWPRELQDATDYTRAGAGDLGAGDINDPHAEHKRSDFFDLRDFNLDAPEVLTNLALCYKYWIALTDCDGFRIDTLKHVTYEEGRNFCGTIKEYAANLGKSNFFLIGEIAGGDFAEQRYLDVIGQNLNAALDIGEMRPTLVSVAKGLTSPSAFFAGFDPGLAVMGSHRNLGNRHVSILDDHDEISGERVRFSSDAASDHQVVAGVALQLLTLGIPCIYYGTEQAFAGPEREQWNWLEWWGSSDAYLREAMFGPEHPRGSGRDGLQPPPNGLDTELPGFGPFGTAGQHCFDDTHPAYTRIAALTALRQSFPVLRDGRQYLRPISVLGAPFGAAGAGELAAWSRILDDEEALCVVNLNGTAMRGADVVVDANLNPPGSTLKVILNSAQSAESAYQGTHAIGSTVDVKYTADGTAYVELREVGPSEVVVLSNHPTRDEGMIVA